MYFKLGQYRHPTGELSLISHRETTKDQAGRPVMFTDRWQLMGQLQYPTATLLAAQAGLQAAYRDENVRLTPFAGLYYDTGLPTAYYWNAFNTIGGIRCVSGPNFPRGDSQQWVNARDYEITLEADFPANLQSNTVEWHETVTIKGGGGARIVGIENRYGPPVIQKVSRATPVVYMQEGSATGRYRYPLPPVAIAPAYLNSPDCDFQAVTPNLNIAGAYGTQTDWKITWRYVMILPQFIPATPVPWNGR